MIKINRGAFEYNELTSVIFNGALPTSDWSWAMPFNNNPGLGAGSISVPAIYLSAYQAKPAEYGVALDAFVGR